MSDTPNPPEEPTTPGGPASTGGPTPPEGATPPGGTGPPGGPASPGGPTPPEGATPPGGTGPPGGPAGPGGPTPPSGGPPGPGGDADQPKQWYEQPIAWAAGAFLVVIVVIAIIVLVNDDDSDDEADSTTTVSGETTTTGEGTSTTVESTTTTTGETTTTTAAETSTTQPTETTQPPDTQPEGLVIEESPVTAELEQATYLALPWDEDVEVTANWYTWEENFVVVYAGWEATEDEPLCPGNSLETDSGFDFISNSPSYEGGCDPEDAFPTLVPEDDDDPAGARTCGSLVIYRTIIPTTTEDGSPTEGFLYASVEQAVDDGYNGATGAVEIIEDMPELDPTAEAYSVPEGWLPGDETEVTC